MYAMDNSSASVRLERAAGQWVDAHGDFLYGYALFRVGDPEIAEILLQRTLAAGIAEWNRNQERTSERAWLITILRHEIIDYFRVLNRQRSTEPSVRQESHFQEFFSNSGKWLEKSLPWPEASSKAAQQKDFVHVLYLCLKEVPRPLAQVFVLRELEGLEIGKICSVTGNSKADIYAMLYRVRLLLHRCLAEKCSGGQKEENSV